MTYEAKNFDHLLGINGLSDELLKNHFTLYQGYVKNFNKYHEKIEELNSNKDFENPAFGELNRRLGWEFNGIRLHEYYFDNLAKETTTLEETALEDPINKNFGSFENFADRFKKTMATRGIGWVVLYLDQQAQKLFIVWINEHDTGHFAGCTPLLVLDAFEHAYMIDYGTKKDAYIDVIFNQIDWNKVVERYAK